MICAVQGDWRLEPGARSLEALGLVQLLVQTAGARLRLRAAANGHGLLLLLRLAAYSLFNRLWDLIRKELEDDSAAVTGVRRRG